MLRLGITRLFQTNIQNNSRLLSSGRYAAIRTSNTSSLTQSFQQWTPFRSMSTKKSTEETLSQPSFISGFSTQGNVLGNAQTLSAPSTQFKTKKPTTPGKRWLKRIPRDHLYKGKAVRSLTIAKRGTGGRNNTGRITIRHRGGGHKRRIRVIDWQRMESGEQHVVRLEHDPGRTAWIALLRHAETGQLSYIVAPQGIKPGDTVISYRSEAIEQQKQESEESEHGITRTAAIDIGNCMPLRMMPVGTIIHNIGLKRNGPAIMARSAGAYAQLIQTGETGYAQVRLSSGEVRLVPVDACATIGSVSNPDHQHEMLGKAGRSRWMGIRPTVRGMAMNACDHPHGGGRGKSKGNKDPRSPWGVLAKGGKTRKTPNQFVVKPRPRR
ncbi:translation protein SH3-like domain-containing protein [Halteromyces radiatus]|uniref:translation protein SH3-like domain-containing protein n=1 Tax=Halteromyces radiatus TaxID=101107 RepID=UPI002220F91A|nr:translation protein SH3-like domain-containing protein [Halteromyces radiatus]KAI8081655.1 translation protein SH3-like domain-containing protein [Halteromyces radiatus]